MRVIRYTQSSDTYLAKKKGNTPSKKSNIPLLLGARLHVDLDLAESGWAPANMMPNSKNEVIAGYIKLDTVSDRQQLKVFYTDVGQGDAILIEAEGAIVIIDGGPNKAFCEVLVKRLASLRRADVNIGMTPRNQLFINAIVISHYDKDHYYGLIPLLNDPQFSFGKIYHNGLPRYGDDAGKDLTLGSIINHSDGLKSISTDLTDIDSVRALAGHPTFLKTKNGNDNYFAKFCKAVIKAKDDGRLSSIDRLYRRSTANPPELLSNVGEDLKFEVLGPVTTKETGAIRLPVFPDPHKGSSPTESHTINGNSIVLRLTYKNNTFLFGGDLNQPAQKYLKQKYGGSLPFRAEVNKACHHGSSDFDLDYLKDVNPLATVFSSGDEGSYDHPLPDAMGAAAKHSVGDFPLVFSTELARDNKTSGRKMLGHINARSNGTVIVMAQKKEKVSKKNPWHTFQLPYAGPFG